MSPLAIALIPLVWLMPLTIVGLIRHFTTERPFVSTIGARMRVSHLKKYTTTPSEDGGTVTIRDSHATDRKVKICPVCKRATRCTVGLNRITGTRFHVYR